VCLHRASGDSPSEVSWSHIWDPLRHPGGYLSPNYRHPELGRQQPLAYLEAIGRNGESPLYSNIYRAVRTNSDRRLCS
jgi:hypothetical protein